MKKASRFIPKAALMIFIMWGLVAFIKPAAAITVTVDYNATGLTPGSVINVPVKIDGDQITSWQFDINYDQNVLTYNTYTPWAGLTPGFPGVSLYTGYVRLGFTYFGVPGTYITYANQVVMTLNFTYNGGATTLSFNTGTCIIGKPVPPGGSYTGVTYVNGGLNGAGVPVYSANGGGNWNVAGNWDINAVPNASNDVFITKNNPITISTNVKSHNLTINAGAQLTLNSTYTLNIGENVMIKSDAANGTGSFIDFGTTTIAGTSTVERYMVGNWDGSSTPTAGTYFHYISSPVSGGTINTFLGDLLNYYDEPTQSWMPLTIPTTIPFNVGQGYSTAVVNPGGVKTFTGGTLNTGDKIMGGLTLTGAVANYSGYNLLGNPYPSALHYQNTWTKTNLNGSVYVWPYGGSGYGNYLVGDGAGSGTLPGDIIPAEQGFFVRVISGTGSMTIPNSARVHSSTALYKDVVPDMLVLSVAGNDYSDKIVVRFDPYATTGFDQQYDAYKLWGLDEAPQLYSILEDNTYSTLNVLPNMNMNNSVNLGFKVGVTGTYSMTASELTSFQSGTSIYLEDKQENKMVNLMNDPTYSFSASPGDPEQRFTLHFNPVGVPSVDSKSIRIYSNDNMIFVNIPQPMQGTIHVYDLVGNEITQQQIVGNTLNKITMTSAKGYYFVKVIGNGNTTSGKVFIQ